MENLEHNIRDLVTQVLKEMNLTQASDPALSQMGVFGNIEDAIQAADNAFKIFIALPLDQRADIIDNIRRVCIAHNEAIAKMAHEETGLGRYEDKISKNLLGINKTPGIEDVVPQAFTNEHGLTLVERAPYGVIGSITPTTNPTVTIISNAIGMLAAGNTVVFNPHPGAKKVSAFVITLLNKAIVEKGGPPNVVTCIESPTIESAKTLMTHPRVALMVVTGGPAVVKAAMNSGKKVIAAGPGNPPVVVDETANIAKAAKDIVDGASFDNNIICICEKEIIVVSSVADRLKEEMKKHGAFELNAEQTKHITSLVISDPGYPGHEGAANKKFVGKDAAWIAREAGINVSTATRLLFCEVEASHPLVWTEQLMPVIPLVRVNDADTAINLAVAVEHGFRHTAVMHSMNIENLSKMAKAMNCSLFVKNGPSFAGLGYGGAGFTSFTIASPTGEGITKASTFTRERRCTLVDHFRII
ncbi:MAG TPA: aldehyde dehydrogenase family protein [Bacteroidales bacterium]|nr:aldehyde dehydrogenase family protein [Bacteroidales bacterium]